MVEIQIRRQTRADGRSAAVVQVAGEVTLDNSPELRRALLEANLNQAGLLVVDLARVQKLDSSGIATLVDLASRTRLNGGRFALSGLPGPVRANLQLAGLEDFFETHASPEEALRARDA